MDMIKARNLTSHTYNTEISDDIVSDIHMRFFCDSGLTEHIKRVGQVFYERQGAAAPKRP